MKHYKADISVRRVGITTAPKIPPDHPNVRFSTCLHRESFPAADITEARQRAIHLVENPSTPEFTECLDFYFGFPFKILEWHDWTDPIEPEGETQIHSCSSHPFLVSESGEFCGVSARKTLPSVWLSRTEVATFRGVFKWIVTLLVYEVDAPETYRSITVSPHSLS